MNGEGGNASLLNSSYSERQLPPFLKQNTTFKLDYVLQFPPPSRLPVSGDGESPDALLLVQAEGGRKVYAGKLIVLWKIHTRICLKSSSLIARFGKLLKIGVFFRRYQTFEKYMIAQTKLVLGF